MTIGKNETSDDEIRQGAKHFEKINIALSCWWKKPIPEIMQEWFNFLNHSHDLPLLLD